MGIFSNIINNLNYLKSDFTGIKFNPSILTHLAIYIFLSLITLLTFYLIGNKIKSILFRDLKGQICFFVEISLGYIFVGSGILILGMLGFFFKPILYSYFLIILIVGILPFNTFRKRLNIFKYVWSDYKKQFINNKLINTAILLFLIIGFLRLITPEVGVDAIWYHTDYPRLYLKSHTMMNIDPRGKYYPAVTPTLSDMIYVFPISLNQIDSSRFIHFSFYLICVLIILVVYQKRYSFSPLAALLFVTSPIVIRNGPSAYAEYQWLFCWLLAVFILTKDSKHTIKNIFLPSILIGATLATKLWMLPFFGVVFIYLLLTNINEKRVRLFKLLTFYTLVCFSIPLLWYLRAWITTGNPLFPAFWSYPNGEPNIPVNISFSLASIKERILSTANISPLSIIGFIALFINSSKIKNFIINNKKFIIFVSILTITHIIINYNYHRFVIPFFSIFSIILAYGSIKLMNVNKFFRFSFYLLFSFLFIYYFVNTLLILPYGLSWADQNKYLTRILSRDNSSYFDYNYQFSKKIAKNDLVATYGLWGFYYADFNHIYSEDIFRKSERSLSIINKRGANKLLLLGGDIDWLCKTEKLTDCSKNKYKLLATYKFPTINSSQYLYELSKYAK